MSGGIKVKALEPFKILYKLPKDINTVVVIGGRGGAKSYEVSKFITFSATIMRERCVVLRDEKEQVRDSIMNEILNRYDTANRDNILSQFYSRLDTGIKDLFTNKMLVFSKGFRATSTEKKANLKSISDIDKAVVEEAEDIRDETKFNTFADSIRKEGSVIIIILNTPDINHWIVKRFFNAVAVPGIDGYFEIVPKDIKGFLCIKTSYKDNPHLPAHIVRRYEEYGDPNSHTYNEFYYHTAILGYASTGRKGQVFKKARPFKLSEYLKLPYKERYGLDFGTASPAGIVGIKIHRNVFWVRQLNYEPKNVLELGKFFCMLNLNHSDEIIADSADPKAIDKLSHGWNGEDLSEDEFRKYPALATGFNIRGAVKGPDSITNGIDLIDSMNFYAVEESADLWKEILNYVYAQDKNGNYTNEPIDDFNHLLDPTRYVISDAKAGSAFGYAV